MLALWILVIVLVAGILCLGLFLAFWGCVALGMSVEDYLYRHHILHHH
jgi:hypothetical protein